MSEKDQFDFAWAALCELWGRDSSPELYAIYRRSLERELGADGAVKAIEYAFTHKTYGFPKPGELIEGLRGDGEEQALIAWEQLLEAFHRAGPHDSVLFADAKITRVVESMGGWLQVCQWPEEEVKFRRQEFLKSYRALSDGGSPRVLDGIVAAYNAAAGYLEHRPKPIVIGKIDPALLPETESVPRGSGAQPIGRLLAGVCAMGEQV